MGRKRSRVTRPDGDLVESLLKHVSLLGEYYAKAFEEGDDRYLGEIAGKLRLLILRGKRNKPLLLELMERFGSRIKVALSDPLEPQPLTIDEYLDRLMFTVRLKDGPVRFTNREFVESWAQQHGAAHEDTSHDRRLAVSRTLPVFIYGQHSHKYHLGAITRTTLSVANEFLVELETRGILKAK